MHTPTITDTDEQAQSASPATVTRFFARVRVTEGCHPFEPANKLGYGAFTMSKGHTISAHRFALIRAEGAPARGQKMQACHHCRTKNCVRPSHLYWGTCKQNAADRKRDGTENHPMGLDHHRAKIDEHTARKFVELYREGLLSVGAIAESFGVSQTCVVYVLKGVTWRAATEGMRVPLRETAMRAIKKGDDHADAKLTAKAVPIIRQRWAAGVSSHVMAKEYGVAPRTIRDVGNRLTWKHIP